MELVVHYAAVGFRPYRETGEFVNVGVVAVEARSRYVAHRLAPPQRTRRITACFPDLDPAVYRDGLRLLEEELAALAIETNSAGGEPRQAGRAHPSQGDLLLPEGDPGLFAGLTRPRTASFFYSSRGTRLAGDLDRCLEELYGRFVEHWHKAPVDHEEKRLARRVRALLRSERLDRLYREAPWVGTDTYHVGIPLAHFREGAEVPFKAIKPLNLAQSTPTRIYTHGDEWIAKVQRLRRVSRLPESFLFVVDKPEDPEGRAAAEDICEALREAGMEVAELGDDEAVIAFARIEESADFRLVAE